MELESRTLPGLSAATGGDPIRDEAACSVWGKKSGRAGRKKRALRCVCAGELDWMEGCVVCAGTMQMGSGRASDDATHSRGAFCSINQGRGCRVDEATETERRVGSKRALRVASRSRGQCPGRSGSQNPKEKPPARRRRYSASVWGHDKLGRSCCCYCG